MFFYIHGFNSTAYCRSYYDLANLLPEVQPLSYDYRQKACFCYQDLCKQIDAVGDTIQQYTFLGSSLGGFFALLMAKKYKRPVIAFNPVTYVEKQLYPFLGVTENFYTKEKWNFTEEILLSYQDYPLSKDIDHKPTIILGMKDSIISPQVTRDFWQKKADFILTEEEHSIADYSKYLQCMNKNF